MTMRNVPSRWTLDDQGRTDAAKPSEARGRQGPSPCAACAVRDLAFCSALEAEEVDRINQIMTEVTYSAPQAVIYEGDPAEHAFNVKEGVVRVSKMLPDGRRQITGFLFPGDFLGLAHHQVYAYTAEAVTKARLCRFPRSRLLGLFDELPSLERRMLSMAADELASAQEQILLLGRKTARERVASFLLTMSRQARRRRGTGNPVELPMSRADIADYLGLTIETVSRTITKLAKEGIIELPNAHTAVIKNLHTLEAVESGEEDD